MADKEWRPFALVRAYVQSLGLGSPAQWMALAGVPASVTRDCPSDRSGWLPFAEARSVARSMGVSGQKEWEQPW